MTDQPMTASLDELEPGDAGALRRAGVVASETRPGTTLVVREASRCWFEVAARNPSHQPGLRFEVDLTGAVGYWHPGGRSARLLPADWSGPTVTSLVASAPVGALYDAAGRVILGWAAAEAVAELSVTAGVSEERKTFAVEIEPVAPLVGDLQLVLDLSGGSLADIVDRLAGWMSDQLPGVALTAPAAARQPVYSTWYTFTQDIDADLVLDEAARAADLGCGSVFIDDGWQRLAHGRGYRGCGDWWPDEHKFPDLAGTVGTLHERGLGVALWIAPLLLGSESDAYPEWADRAPAYVDGLHCHVLDPRDPRVRAFAAETCLRLVETYDVDLLKIDFLDQAMVYRSEDAAAAAGDRDDVGEAMADLLAELRAQLAAGGHDGVALEFRQPYVSPAIARHGEILRANDCPADSAVNRQAVIDARLVAVGQTVHSDPMMWGTTGGPEAVAQQLYAGWFSVPQISMRLSALDPDQLATLRDLLARWRADAPVTLDGELEVHGAERGYDLVSAYAAGSDRSVVVRYAPVVVELDSRPAARTTIINATASPTLLLRTTREVIDAEVTSASGRVLAGVVPTGTGLMEWAVPPFGRVTLAQAPVAGP